MFWNKKCDCDGRVSKIEGKLEVLETNMRSLRGLINRKFGKLPTEEAEEEIDINFEDPEIKHAMKYYGLDPKQLIEMAKSKNDED